MTTEIKLTLPMPPSTNMLFGTNFNSKRRFKTKKYEEWEELARIKLNAQNRFKIHGDEWLEIDLKYYFPIYNKNGTKKRKDTFNYEKATSDFLADNIEGFEDKHIKRGIVEKIDSDRNEVDIIVREIV